MATHPQTGIDVNVDRFAQVAADDSIIQWGVKWPTIDGRPIIGETPYRWFRIVYTDPPSEGPQYYAEQTAPVLVPATPAPPAGYPAGEIRTAWRSVVRPIDEQSQQVEAVYKSVLNAIIPPTDEPETRTRTMRAIQAQAQGLTLTPAQSTALAQLAADESACTLNAARRDALLAAVQSGAVYDLFAGWTLPRADVEALFGAA